MLEATPEKTLRVLRLPFNGEPRVETLPHTLEALQQAVGGRIEVFPVRLDSAVGICDEEFLYHGEPENIAASWLRAPGVAKLHGDVLIVGDVPGTFGDISNEHIALAGILLGRDIKEVTE